jgi:cyclopropane-fatty-acyl-phospholipid synthase
MQLLNRMRDGGLIVRERVGDQRVGWLPDGDAGPVLRVDDPRFYRRVLFGGSLGFAEAYLDGDWSTDNLPALLQVLARNMAAAYRVDRGPVRLIEPLRRLGHWLRRNTRSGSRRNIAAHYDLSNEFFALFLDDTMTYSSGVFEHQEATLRDASVAKYDRICCKLQLKPSDHLLEIGTGWGGMALHAASQYGCRVTTTTISKQQFQLASQRIAQAGLQGRITLLAEDYRDLSGQYDKLVSIEMIEAVGHQYLPVYFRKCSDLLKPDGMMGLQAITIPDHRYEGYRRSVDFIRRYIFPGGCLPCTGTIGRGLRQTDLQVVHWEDFGLDYARTLACWRANFQANLDRIRALGYPETFLRMWDFYLSYCEAGFRERLTGVSQIVLTKPLCRLERLR